MTNILPNSTKIISDLNDKFRQKPHMMRGHVLFSTILGQYSADEKSEILNIVMNFNDFNEDNDPYGEHDFGSFVYQGEKMFFKIDYYDNDLKYHSSDATDSNVTTRVLTIMLAEEY